MRLFPIFFVVLACADTPSIENPVTTAPVMPQSNSRSIQSEVPATPVQTVDFVRIAVMESALAEDGRGGQRMSPNAVAIEIETEGWPGRAMDPVLRVGEYQFTAYTHVSPTVLRYVVDGPELLPAGAEAVVHFGRQEVARFLLPAVGNP